MTKTILPSSLIRTLAALALCLGFSTPLLATETTTRQFDIAAGPAEQTLREFATQARDTQFFFAADSVSGMRTSAVRGNMTARAALEIMVEGSGLTVMQDEQSGALTVRRTDPEPDNARRPANRRNSPAVQDQDEQIVRLSPFEVAGAQEQGYLKTNSITTSRIGVPIIREPASIEIISSELLKDFAVTDFDKVFRYSSGVVTGESEVGQAGIFTMRGFHMYRYFNGVPLADSFSITPILLTDNIDRVEIAKGAVGLFYGTALPNGVANYITKKPQFKQATSMELAYGTHNLTRASVDLQNTINRSTAFRLITSYQSKDGRYDVDHSEYIFVAPSVVFRPNNKFEFSAEFNFTKSRASYPVFAWDLAINQDYYRDVSNPSRQILDYMKTAYNLADDSAAQALIQQRWGSGHPRGFLINWSEDIYGMTGRQPYPITGSKIDWWRISPLGNKFTPPTDQSGRNGTSSLSDVGLTFTPTDNFSIRYRWLRNDVKQTFMRALASPNGGLRPDGRFKNLDLGFALDLNPDDLRQGISDTQQVDIVYETEAFGMKHKFIGGAEWTRLVMQYGAVNVDYSGLSPVTDSFGNVLTGSDIFRYHDPFAGNPEPNIYDIMDGAPFSGRYIPSTEAAYLSYRGSAFADRLNLLLGARRTTEKMTGNSETNPTMGVIYEFIPGFHAFVSYSQTVVFTNTLSAVGLALTPADDPRPLPNEKDKGFEIGLKTNWRDNTLSGTIAYYKAERDGIAKADTARILADPRNQDNTTANDVQFYINGGLDRVQGIEADLTWTPNNRFQGILNWNYMWEAQTISDPSIDTTKRGRLEYIKNFEDRLQKTPEWQVNVVGRYTFANGPLEGLSIGGAVRYSSDYIATDFIYYNAIVPSETLFDVFASYRTRWFNTPTNLRLGIQNLTNEINDITRGQGTEATLAVDFTF